MSDTRDRVIERTRKRMTERAERSGIERGRAKQIVNEAIEKSDQQRRDLGIEYKDRGQ